MKKRYRLKKEIKERILEELMVGTFFAMMAYLYILVA